MGYKGNYLSNLPDWKPDQDKVIEPPEEKKNSGWEVEEKPPAQWFNWLHQGFFKSMIELDDALNNLNQTLEQDISDLNNQLTLAKGSLETNITDHKSDKNNPHQVTTSQIAALNKNNNLSDITDVAQARTNLGLAGTSNTTHYHDGRYYTKNEVETKVSNLVNSAPETLDTLNELAQALGDDPNFATTISNQIGTKLSKSSNLADLSNKAIARTNLGLTGASNTTHYHDGRYYTKSEVETKVAANSLERAYPIGSIYLNAKTATNPRTLLGFGTWQRYAKGRVLVGVDENDDDFDTLGYTDGEKKHKLEEWEMPRHRHGGGTANVHQPDGAGSYEGNAPWGSVTTYAGGDQPHNNLQPYITVYMWVRTA
jgi:hypothetical protein